MGNGIAHVFALAGYDVLLNDISDDSLKKAVQTIDRNLERQVSRGKIAAEEKAAAEAAGTDSPAPKKSVGERLRAAAKNIRGAEKKDKKTAAPKASKPARGAQKKSTTPRKAGGS